MTGTEEEEEERLTGSCDYHLQMLLFIFCLCCEFVRQTVLCSFPLLQLVDDVVPGVIKSSSPAHIYTH